MADKQHSRRGIVFLIINSKYFNGKFYKLGELPYHLYEFHLNWFTCTREPDSFIFTSWEWVFWSKQRPQANVIKCGYHGNDTPADPNMAVFVHPPQVTYLHTKNEGGLKIYISNFASLSGELLIKFRRILSLHEHERLSLDYDAVLLVLKLKAWLY